MSKLCRKGLLMIMIMILCHSNLHMPEICGKIYRIYVLHISPNSAYFSAYFASKSSAYYKATSLFSVNSQCIQDVMGRCTGCGKKVAP